MMDESPITKLVQHATAAHAAVTAQREAARQVAAQAAQNYAQAQQAQSAGSDAAPN
jgi:hypothetical protein